MVIKLITKEKQFFTSLVESMYQDDSVRSLNGPLLTGLLSKINTMTQDPNGINFYTRFGYSHGDLWIIDLNEEEIEWTQSILCAWFDINGYFTRPTPPGHFPSTTQMDLATGIEKKLRGL